jgi:uncharacterized protein YndB with AHSA1/START domain
MPTDKDFKRLVRGRMRKTGESYTTARAAFLPKTKQPSLPPADYARIAGQTDATIKAKTGCTWERWVKTLDQAGAHEWPHREIARYVSETYKVPGWWTQAVTVGYERIKGLRGVGQRRGGGYEANKTKTFAVPLAKLYRTWSEARTRARWLPDVKLRVRTATPKKSVRVTWPDDTSVNLYFESKGRQKSVLAVQHGKLADRAAMEQMKAYWGERLAALAEVLG